MGLRPTQEEENGFCSATALHGSVALPFVIPTAVEGSAVQPTFTGNVFRQIAPGFYTTRHRQQPRVRLSVKKAA
jgi:hypothetical protein